MLSIRGHNDIYTYKMPITIKFSDKLIVEQKYSMFELSQPPTWDAESFNAPQELLQARMLGYNPTRIFINGEWFDTIPLHALARTKSSDGYYRCLYIQINYNNGEYYIGKVNRKRWKEILNYHGSGLLFTNKYEKHKDEFVRYYIAACETQKETEELEAKIVNSELLKDEKCLNLVQGGGGTSEHYDKEKRSRRQKEIMKEHPEFFQSMIQAHKKIYCSGPSPQRELRNKHIKETMSSDYYRNMTSERIRNWKDRDPEGYAKARENNKLAQQSEESKEKKRKGRERWIEEHPEQYQENKKKTLEAAHSPEAEAKRSNSLKEFYKNDPRAAELVRNRSEASVKACQKSVNMLDLETGEILMTFPSQHEAARWLVNKGLAKNTNCVSSINSVCQKKPCTTGYGYRKKAYGFGWEYAE